MRDMILGTVAGLVLGTLGALAYSHYADDASMADLQAKLDAANSDLAKAMKDRQQIAKDTSSVSDQVGQLEATNKDLKDQLDTLKNAPAATAAPPQAINPATLASMIRGMFRGGGFQTQQRMVLLKTRLHLTADQATKIQAAMDADSRKRRELGRQLFQGGKIDPADAASANTLDKTLTDVLSPDQQSAYQQVQADEKASRADTEATVQINQVAPLLQLTESQKDQVFNALYQVQLGAPDPSSLLTNPNAATALASQAQATQSVLQKYLSQDQYALYQQQAAVAPTFGGRPRGGGDNGGGGGNGNPGAGAGTPTITTGSTVTGFVSPTTPGAAPVLATNSTLVVNPPDASATNAPTATNSTTATTTTNAAPTQ